MEARQRFMLFATIVVAVGGLVSTSRRVRTHGIANLPRDVFNRVEETRMPLSCEAHVLPTTVSRTGTVLAVTVDLRVLPSHVNSTFFILDELYVNLQANSIALPANDEELWVEESQFKGLLARLPLASSGSRNSYKAIKMRRIFTSWYRNNRDTGSLELKLPSTQIRLASNLAASNIYFVIYANPITGPLDSITPVNCNSHDVIIKPQSPLNFPFKTKICSAPDEITFPFNASTHFDIAAALRKSLKDKPVPGNAAVLLNPKCCHGTKSVSRMFVKFNPNQSALQIVKLENVGISECGCGIV